MRYSEGQAIKNGERNVVTWQQLEEWLGQDPNDIWELALDILNGIYAVEDVLSDIEKFGD